MAVANGAPTLELLTWLSTRARTYPETMEAWRTSCPRLTVWEDALLDGLVAVVRREDRTRGVVVTQRGEALLAGAERTRPVP